MTKAKSVRSRSAPSVVPPGFRWVGQRLICDIGLNAKLVITRLDKVKGMWRCRVECPYITSSNGFLCGFGQGTSPNLALNDWVVQFKTGFDSHKNDLLNFLADMEKLSRKLNEN
jgi:hypothetical protein